MSGNDRSRRSNVSHEWEIPLVCFIEDLCRVLRVSRTTVEKLRRHGAFPIEELPPLDKRPRWSGAAVQRFLEGQGSLPRRGSTPIRPMSVREKARLALGQMRNKP